MIASLYSLIGILIFLVSFYFLYFLRQPERKVPHDNKLFVSPANGKIIAIIHQDQLLLESIGTGLYKDNNKVIEDWTEGFNSGATLISIMMTPRDVHYQKAPLEAKFLSKKYVAGRFFNAMKSDQSMRSTFQNEYNNILFQTPEGYKFRIIQIAGKLARRIEDYLKPEQTIEQGETRGLIKFGSQVSVILDTNFEIVAQIWEKVVEGESILAQKKNNKASND